MRNPILKLMLSVPLLILGACSTEKRFTDAPPTEFLNIKGVDRKSVLKNVPFDHSWVAPGVNIDSYSKIIIAPVTPDYVSLDKWELSMNPFITGKESYKKEVSDLANYTTEKLKESFTKSDNNRFQIVDKPGRGTLSLEMALTEVVFGKPIASAGALVAPVPGAGVALSAVADPSVAMELRIRDSETGTVVATASDRGFPITRIVNVNKLTATSACREVVGNTAKLIVASLNEGKLKAVKKEIFTLTPW